MTDCFGVQSGKGRKMDFEQMSLFGDEAEIERDRSRGELDRLFDHVSQYREKTEFAKLLSYVRKLDRISPYNAMLIYLQKPGSRYTASPAVWKRDFGRDIKRGATPLIVLKTFGPVSFVYDVSDTEGDDDFPKELLSPFDPNDEDQISPAESYITDEETLNSMLRRAMGELYCDGVECIMKDLGSACAGYIRREERIICADIKKTRYYLHSGFYITLNRSVSSEQSLNTLFHELGHMYCGHMTPYLHSPWPDRSGIDPKSAEFEAECASWLVCERYGIRSSSTSYLHNQVSGEGDIPRISFEAVFRAAGSMIALLDGKKQVNRKLIERKEKLD